MTTRLRPLTPEQIEAVRMFLDEAARGLTREQWSQSYQSWGHGGRRAWDMLRSGGTHQHSAVAWYQHTHKPGSKEWRPAIIIDAVCRAAGLDDWGVFLLSCANCGADLGRITGVAGEEGRKACSRCAWWIKWVWVKSGGFVAVDFTEDRDGGRWHP